jgi:membrane protease YdiL (CAAX protease family)
LRAFLGFLASLCVAALAGALLAYPAFELVQLLGGPWPFHRIANRITLLVLVLVLIVYCRRMGLTARRDFGYGLPRPRFLRVALLFGLIGALSAALGALFLLGAHLRLWSDPAQLGHIAVWLRWLLTGLGSGIAVALIEETVMRGALHTAISRESGPLAAALLTAPLFALLHFYARTHIAAQAVGPGSGLVILAAFFSPWAHPLEVGDAFLAWLAVGLILSVTRIWTGNIAVALGLHAGWVMVLRILQLGTVPGSESPYASWVGRYDGLLGYWLLPWAALLMLGLWLTRSVWVPYARAARGASSAIPSSRSTGSLSSR